jgi:hypothetical protein
MAEGELAAVAAAVSVQAHRAGGAADVVCDTRPAVLGP